MSTHERDRGAIWPRRPGSAWQYACVESRSSLAIGVTAMLEPIPPAGAGWQLASSCVIPNANGLGDVCFHWWRR